MPASAYSFCTLLSKLPVLVRNSISTLVKSWWLTAQISGRGKGWGNQDSNQRTWVILADIGLLRGKPFHDWSCIYFWVPKDPFQKWANEPCNNLKCWHESKAEIVRDDGVYKPISKLLQQIWVTWVSLRFRRTPATAPVSLLFTVFFQRNNILQIYERGRRGARERRQIL